MLARFQGISRKSGASNRLARAPKRWRRAFRGFLRESDAATAAEYAVLLALILMAIIAAIGSVGARTGGMWGGIQTDITAAGVGS